ncbi:MAG: pyrroline-5-carboxylate reductase [Lachnospiraceae bacterium]|nr:pyrroline-5-carboxylate reductase [Lachnospiraceae bacterium]
MSYNTIGFIGAGNMASAIISGLIKSKMFEPQKIYVSSKSKESAKKLQKEQGVNACENNNEVVKISDVLVLAVKPVVFKDVINGIKDEDFDGKLVISIAAGLSMEQITGFFEKDVKIVRTMPNTPALVGEAMTAMCSKENVDDNDLKFAVKVFDSFGKTEIVPEKLMDVVTGVSGSSPAYVYMFIEALADGAVAEGMPRKQAYNFAAQAVLGSAKMVLETGEHPGALKDAVCSPGGTTIEAVAALENLGFRSAVIEAERACIDKSRRL